MKTQPILAKRFVWVRSNLLDGTLSSSMKHPWVGWAQDKSLLINVTPPTLQSSACLRQILSLWGSSSAESLASQKCFFSSKKTRTFLSTSGRRGKLISPFREKSFVVSETDNGKELNCEKFVYFSGARSNFPPLSSVCSTSNVIQRRISCRGRKDFLPVELDREKVSRTFLSISGSISNDETFFMSKQTPERHPIWT